MTCLVFNNFVTATFFSVVQFTQAYSRNPTERRKLRWSQLGVMLKVLCTLYVVNIVYLKPGQC